MSGEQLSRRDFLRASALAAMGVLAAACAQPTPQVIEKPVTVVVEKQVPVEKEVIKTVVVEKEKAVEKVVKETVVVEKPVTVEKVVKETVVQEKVITATPVKMKYKEAPELAALVQQGKLPPVDERLPGEPMVIKPWEEIGQYGGTWHRLAVGPTDIQVVPRINYNQIIRWNKDGSELIPNVVTSWEVSKDSKEFTFHLRKGMKWSDGHPYTTDDLAFAFEDVMTDKELTPTPNSYWMRGGELVKFSKIDAYNYKLSFAAPYPLFVFYCAGSYIYGDHQLPKHYLQQFHVKYVDKAKLEAAAKAAGFQYWYQLFQNKGGDVDASQRNNPERPVIGAWKVVVPPPKQPVIFERNPFYWKVDTAGNQLPYIDRIEHMIVQNADQVNLRAMAGEVDMQFRHIVFDNYPLFKENAQKGDYRILEWEQGLCTENGFFFNYEHQDTVLRDIFRDKRFRYACSLGLDRREIIEAVYLGVGEPTQVSPSPSSPFYWEEYAKWMTEYDPDRANAYLDEMGLTKRDSEGYRLRPDGKRLRFEFEYVPQFVSYRAQGELFVAHWKKLGIELVLKETERTLWEQRTQSAMFDMSTWQTGTTFNPIIRRDWFACKTRPFETTYRRWYLTKGKEGVEPPKELRILELYELDDQFEATSDMEEWKRIVRKMLEIQKDQLHYIGVSTSPPFLVITKNNFRNVPEKALGDWQCMTPGNTVPEQYFIKQG